jgi:hypothetical protein
VFAVALFAQSDRGTITGKVSDPAGAVVASAAVEARNQRPASPTGITYQAATCSSTSIACCRWRASKSCSSSSHRS